MPIHAKLASLAGGPAGGLGLQLGGRLLKTFSARKEAQRQRDAQLKELQPAEDQLKRLNFGATASEGALFQGVQRRSLAALGRRGVIRSNIAGAEVAQALAPVESAFQKRREDLSFNLAAAKARIQGDTDLPGFGAAFGETLGDAGSLFALRAGQKQGDKFNDNPGGEDLDSQVALNSGFEAGSVADASSVSLTQTLSQMKAAGIPVDDDIFKRVLSLT